MRGNINWGEKQNNKKKIKDDYPQVVQVGSKLSIKMSSSYLTPIKLQPSWILAVESDSWYQRETRYKVRAVLTGMGEILPICVDTSVFHPSHQIAADDKVKKQY